MAATIYEFFERYTRNYWDYQLIASKIANMTTETRNRIAAGPYAEYEHQYLLEKLADRNIGYLFVEQSNHLDNLSAYASSNQHIISLQINSKRQHYCLIAGESADNIYVLQSLDGIYAAHFVSLNWEDLLLALRQAFLGNFLPLVHANASSDFISHFPADSDKIAVTLQQIANGTVFSSFVNPDDNSDILLKFQVYRRKEPKYHLANLIEYYDYLDEAFDAIDYLDEQHVRYLQRYHHVMEKDWQLHTWVNTNWQLDKLIPREVAAITCMHVKRQRMELGMDNTAINNSSIVDVVSTRESILEGDPADLRDDKVYVYTDGSASDNQAGGWAYVFTKNGQILQNGTNSGKMPAPTTNNQAELTAVYYALHIAAQAGYRDFTLFCDSTYTIKAVTTWWRGWEKNNWQTKRGKPVKNLNIIQAIITLVQLTNVTIRHIKAHNDYRFNEEADRLAKAARLS